MRLLRKFSSLKFEAIQPAAGRGLRVKIVPLQSLQVRDIEAFKKSHGELLATDLTGQKSFFTYENDARVLYLLQEKDTTTE